MPIRDVEAQNASLDNDYGPARGPNAASSHQLVLLDVDGVELAGGGYARATVLPAAWPAANEGSKSVTVTFAAATGEWEPAYSWQLHGADGHVWDEADLVDPLEVTGAGSGPQVTVTVFYDTTS